MDKQSFLFLSLICGISLIFAYEGIYPAYSGPSISAAMGLSAFLMLCASLLIGPLAVLFPKQAASLIQSRRAVGLAAFALALLHFLLAFSITLGWNVYLLGSISFILGLAAVFIIFVLGITSNNWSERHLGYRAWKAIQRFNYLAFVLSFAHFIFQAKSLPFLLSSFPKVHWAEIFLLLLGLLTAGAQIAGFFVVRKRLDASKSF